MRIKITLITSAILLLALTLRSQQIVKDIYSGNGGSNPANLTDLNGTLVFTANDGINGWELWKSNGTAAGTVLLKDMMPGGGSQLLSNFIKVGNNVFFKVEGLTTSLWKTDGTTAGTVRVKEINPMSGGALLEELTDVNGTLFFMADNGINGIELWKSDGTETGTVMVKDIVPGMGDSYPKELTAVNGTLFFVCSATNGFELWKSDGTAAGTELVKDINTGSDDSNPSQLTNVNGTLFFSAYEPVNGTELWKSDGTAAGTILLKDILPGSVGSGPHNLTSVNGTLFFAALESASGNELWKSNGTTSGTVLVKDIIPGSTGSSPSNLFSLNNTLYFGAFDAGGGGLWRSDGTAAGTILVKNTPGLDIPFELTEVKGNLFFRIFYGTGELWKSDGTTAGTASLLTVPGSSPMQAPLELTAVNETLFFVGYDTANGDELWKYGGGNSPSGPLSFIKVLGTGYEFSAALCEDGTVRAWGDNGTGSLGTGNNIYYNYPAKVVDLTDIIDISSGLYHTVALKKDGTVWAWGDNYHGQCGNGTFSLNGYKTPVQVIGLSDIITVAAGENHNLALKKDGTVWAWGENDAGQLGDGTTTKSSFAKKVNGISGMTAIAGGMSFSIALKGDGTVWSWGLNYNGQLGDGTKTNRHTPVQVQGLTGIISIAAAKLSHVLALKNDKTVWGWGANSRGQLGNGSTAPEVKLPVQMNISGVNAVSTGATFSLMLKNDGTLWGCGYNSFDGTLGINTSNSEHHNPIQVSNITGVKAMSAGTAHSLAVLNDGSVWAWGRNNFGQIGDETDATRLAPVIVEKMCKVVPGLEEPQKIASGLNIYPNPSSGKFTIKVQDDKRQISNAKVLVYNVIGETVYQSTEQTLDEAKIDLGYQPRGIYFYKITSKKGSLLGSGKLVVTY